MAAFASPNDINEQFASALNGQSAVNQDQLIAMFQHFIQNEGQMSPNADLSDEQRMANFHQSVWRVIKHNAQPGVSWKKGLNAYSDLTDEQFADYFNINADTVAAE